MYTSVDLKIVGESAQLSLSDRPRWAGQEVYPILPPLLDWSSIQTWTELLSASGLASKPVEEISNSLRFSLITLSLLDLAHREESDPERWWHALCLLDELSHSNTDGFGEHARSLMSSILPQESRLERRGQTSDKWSPEPLSQRSQVSSLSELLRGPDPDELEAQFAQLIHKVQQDKDRAQGTPSDEYELQAWRDLFGDQTQNLASLSFEESLSRRTLHFLSRDPRLCSGGCTQALEWLNMRNRRIEYAYRLIWSSSGFLCLIGLFALRWRRELPLRVDRSRSPRFKECFLFPLSTPDARRDLFKGSLMLIIPPLGWVMNMGHRLDVVSRIFHDQAPYHRGFSPLGKTFLRGLKALIAILIYLSPAIGAAALGAYLNQCWLLIFSALLFLLAVYILPGGMTYNAAHEDISYLYRPDRAALRAFSGGLTYLWAWVISLCAILLSPLGLLLFGIGFFYTSVWAWMVVGYAFSRALSLKEHTQSAD